MPRFDGRLRFAIAGLFAAGLLTCGKPTCCAQETERLQRFERELEELRSLLKVPGLSAAVVKDQQLLWAKGFGLADRDGNVPATENTPYRIASLTKTFASTLVLQLVESGKVDLDHPISKYTDDFKDDSVKIRHILTHTSEGTPGERYSYNGDRYAHVGAVIEKSTGKSFRVALAENILDKLEMTSSVPGQDVLSESGIREHDFNHETRARYAGVLDRLAKPYSIYADQSLLSAYPPKRINAGSGLISTVVDLAKYDIALDRHILLKKQTQEKAWTPAISNDGGTLPYGLGWFVQEYRGQRLVWHYGYWGTFSGLILKVPEKNVTLILLANSDGLSAPFAYPFGLGAGDVSWSAFACVFLRLFVFEDLYKREVPAPNRMLSPEELAVDILRLERHAGGHSYGDELRAHHAIHRYLASRRAGLRREIKLDPDIYNDYAGQYELFPGNVITVTRDGGRLMMQRTGDEEKVELFPESITEFFTKSTGVQVAFVKGEPDRVTQIVLYQFGPMHGRRVNGSSTRSSRTKM